MIKPYNRIFAELEPLLRRLHFEKTNESTYGVIYCRKDAYRLTVCIEYGGDGFSVDLERVGGGNASHMAGGFLMEALAPEKWSRARQVAGEGRSESGLFAWWEIFLEFLLEYESVVFTLPAPCPAWDKYVAVYNREIKKFAIKGLEEIS